MFRAWCCLARAGCSASAGPLIRELPEGVLVLGELNATGRSGTEVRLPMTWHARFRDGIIIGLKAFSDRETALRELGTH